MFRLFVAVVIVTMTFCQMSYRKDGDFIVGAVLPLSKSEQGKCTAEIDPKGIAIMEGIKQAQIQIETPGNFDVLRNTTSIGYDIRDSCGDMNMEKNRMYDLNKEKLDYEQKKTQKKPVDIVMSSFTKNSYSSLDILNIESIPQISFDSKNARLTHTMSEKEKYAVNSLISVYPDIDMKTHAIADLIKEFGFEYVHVVYSDDHASREGASVLNARVKEMKICTGENIMIHSEDDVMENNVESALKAITKNKLVKAVVMLCSEDIEKEFYKHALTHKITSPIFISAGEWQDDQTALKMYGPVVEGMFFVINNEPYFKLKQFFETVKPDHSDWIEKLYNSLGKDEDKLHISLSKNALSAHYAFNGIYAIVSALSERKKGENLVDAFKNLKFFNPVSLEDVYFTDHLTTTRKQFAVYNFQESSSKDLSAVKLGTWVANHGSAGLKINKSFLRFKNGSVEKPLSLCSEPCMMGFQRQYIDEEKCCWKCEKCPEGKVSNVTNSEVCITCEEGKVANPSQSQCVKYKLETFHWFHGTGVFLIFLLVIGVCCALFGMGILSQNRDHDVVNQTGYNTLMFYCIGCLALFLSPIPLLIQPTVTSCSSYIAVFNLGLTVVFSVLFARSQFVNSHFDDEGNLTKTSCSSYPRGLTMFVIVGIQLVIMIAGLTLDPPLTMHNETDQWDVRYFECSSWASYVFWIGFGYNIALSILCNFFSCTSTKMNANCEELKYSLIALCVFYLLGLVEIILFYRVVDAALAGGQGIMCVLFGLSFFMCFMWPKTYIILFRSKEDGKSIKDPLLLHEEDPNVTTAIHASSGFKGFGVVQMKIKDEA